MNYGGPPQPDFLQQVHAAFTGGAAPTGPVMLGGPPQPAPPMPAEPAPVPVSSPMPLEGGTSGAGPNMSLPPPPPAPAPAPAPEPSFQRPQFPLQMAGRGGSAVIPAHETELRGPTLRAAQGERNEAMEGAIQAVAEKNERTAAAEYAMALDAERKASIREDAAMHSAAERQEEMAQRQADFDATVKSMSQASIDPNRFWAKSDTGTKVGAMISLFLGGIAQGYGAKSNPGMDAINRMIEQDIKAQEFQYMALKDTANAKQTAFSMAMQKYNNADAARAAARAAATDALQTQTMKAAAMWKGADAQNRAAMAQAALQDERMNQIAQGIMFVQPRVVSQGPVFVDPRTGITYTNKEAQGVSKEFDAQEHDLHKVGVQGAIDLTRDGAKADAAAQKDIRGEMVQLPNGDTIRAPSGAEGQKLRSAASSVHETRALVNEAKAILNDSTWRASPDKRGRMEQIQADLKVQFKNQAELGALSKDDYALAMEGTVDLFGLGPGKETRLDRIGEKAERGIRNMVKTYPDAPGTAKGQMPASFTAHGKK